MNHYENNNAQMKKPLAQRQNKTRIYTTNPQVLPMSKLTDIKL